MVEDREEGRALRHDGEAAEKRRRRSLLAPKALTPSRELGSDQPRADVGSTDASFRGGDGFGRRGLLRPDPLQFVSRFARGLLQLLILRLRGSRFGEPAATPTLDDWGPLVVPANRLFMLGDNRYDSKDGRYWGFVPRENVRGRPVFVYYSYRADDSDRPLPFLTDIRWGRIGTIIR